MMPRVIDEQGNGRHNAYEINDDQLEPNANESKKDR